jgi:GNAT superfamily N-acetyltransferase
MQRVSIEEEGLADFGLVVGLVERLLQELGEEGDETGVLDLETVREAWERWGDGFRVFVARSDAGGAVGLLTVVEAFAIYANGPYGIINEMYVVPEYRSGGVGRQLLDAAKRYGLARGWSRLDVTAPESERWERTRRFYEREGFAFTGPKLKFVLR